MQMRAFLICSDSHHSLLSLRFLQAATATKPISHPSSSSLPPTLRILDCRFSSLSCSQPYNATSPNVDSAVSFSGDQGDDDDEHEDEDIEFEIEIEKTGNNSRRIRSKIVIEASLQTVWDILTDYERLADFIPGLAVSKLLEKRANFARLFQIGQQKLAFGLNFNAKGVIDCYEKDLESLPNGQRRDIEFKMTEGDFKRFEGKWSIEQLWMVQDNIERCKDGNPLEGQEFHTTLLYVVDVEPKLWLPVQLVENRLCRDIKTNLSCIRLEARRTNCRVPDHS